VVFLISREACKRIGIGISPAKHVLSFVEGAPRRKGGRTRIRLRTFAIAMLFAFLALGAPAILANEAQDLAIVEKYLAAQARRERGEEFKEGRKILTGDINRDGVPDTVVLYTIEGQGGSNNHVQYLAVFVRSRGKLALLTQTSVGGKSHRAVELKAIGENQIHLDTLDYFSADAACCPSKKGTTRYVVVNRKLQEK
jgi:hypothetical protein